MALKQSFSLWSFVNKGIETPELLKQAKTIGYDAVELLDVEMFDMTIDNGLLIASHMAHQSIDRGMNDPAEHDRIVREIESNIALAVKYKIPNLIVFSGNRRDGLTDQEGLDNCIQCLHRVVTQAEDAGVTLVMELLNSKIDHRRYQCDRTAWGADLCKAVGSGNVKLLYDIYHMQIMEGDIINTIRTYHPYIGHYHTAGVPGRHDLDQSQELYYPAIFQAIRETGYDGYIGHEFLPKGNPVDALRTAYEIV